MSESIDKFLKTIEDIRNPDTGCIWNLKQSHASLKRYLLEELYEALEAIDKVEEKELEQNFSQYEFVKKSSQNVNDSKKVFNELKEELGDLLLQIVLHARMAEEKGLFNFNNVVDSVNEKMIKRHPHVFGKDAAANTKEVDRLWDAEKAKEKSERNSIFEGIPQELPALAAAWKISKKAVKESFEWDEEEKLWGQLDSEVAELKEVIADYRKQSGKDPYKDGYDDDKVRTEAELELGDILFTVVNIARWYKIDPEDALRKVNNKFIARFNVMLDICKSENKRMKEYSIEELEAMWQKAKIQLNKAK